MIYIIVVLNTGLHYLLLCNVALEWKKRSLHCTKQSIFTFDQLFKTVQNLQSKIRFQHETPTSKLRLPNSILYLQSL
jgi:hypothetical protein